MNRKGLPRTYRIPPALRVLGKVTINEDGCWIFGGSISNGGYGQLTIDGKRRCSHRVTYEHFRGKIPDGLFIDHLCRVRACCNPDHLEPVTPRENIMRGDGPKIAGQHTAALMRAKTECKHGHPFSADNTWVSKLGHRYCKTCRRLRMRTYTRNRATA